MLKNVSIKLRPEFTNSEDIPNEIKKFPDLKYSFLHRETVHRNWLGQFHQFYSGESEVRMLNLDISYETPAGISSKTLKFDLNDFAGGLNERSEVGVQMKEVVKVLKDIAKSQKDISKSIRSVAQAFEPTGIRIAHTSIKQLKNDMSEISVVNPLKVGATQVAEILGLPNDQNVLLIKFLRDLEFRRNTYKSSFEALSAKSKSRYLELFDDPTK